MYRYRSARSLSATPNSLSPIESPLCRSPVFNRSYSSDNRTGRSFLSPSFYSPAFSSSGYVPTYSPCASPTFGFGRNKKRHIEDAMGEERYRCPTYGKKFAKGVLILMNYQSWWLETSVMYPRKRYIEASAKENIRVTDIFRTLLELSGFPRCKAGGGALEDIPQNENAKNWDVTGGLSLLRRVNTARARSSNRTLPKAPDESVNVQKSIVIDFQKGNISHRDHLEKQSTHPTLSLPPEESTLKRHASLRISRNNKQDKEKEQLQRKTSDDGSKLTRSSSLIRRTKHLSLKMRRPGEKGANEEKEDESDCKIS
ncbi:hypothetical protein WR25_25052 [Diploscapter pachys]|uniref:Uncharacterized protein n=1 Tax=Diploscapter pachys TaxID=2018661 RepID=A0A2A2K753_9BILA|nr:hypothetical protein WR25_25052 [Diploscapter pachys]